MHAKNAINAPFAFLFPGQGAHYVGMAADLIDRWPNVARLFQLGSDLTGHDLVKIVKEGPEDDLGKTNISQVVIFLHSMAVLSTLEQLTDAPLTGRAACGLSLGEYSALVFAGSLEPEAALEVVAFRGRYMQEAAEAHQGTMSTVLGLDRDQVEELVKQARGQDVLTVANWNSPTQIVVSGAEAPVERLEELARTHGARRVVRIKVAGAFHSPLMQDAAEKLLPHLERLTIRPPRIPFIPNRTGRAVSDPEEIRRCLADQVTGTVLWTPTIEALVASGVKKAIEAGPGRVLAGLAKRTARDLVVTPIGTQAEAEQFIVQ